MSTTGRTLVLRAIGSLVFVPPNGVPNGWRFVFQSGDFLDAIVTNGTGDLEIAFLPGFGVDEVAATVVCTPRAAQAASGLTTIGATRPSDQRIRFTIVQEQGGGGASTRADVAFDFFVVSRPGA